MRCPLCQRRIYPSASGVCWVCEKLIASKMGLSRGEVFGDCRDDRDSWGRRTFAMISWEEVDIIAGIVAGIAKNHPPC